MPAAPLAEPSPACAKAALLSATTLVAHRNAMFIRDWMFMIVPRIERP
jgi:hypothetical protein